MTPVDVVEVRITRLDRLPPGLAVAAARAASPDASARAARLRDPLLARRRLVAAGLLRLQLAERLGVEAAEVCFDRLPDGKPVLRGRFAGLAFNLSHSGDLVVVALADRKVGVDVERHDAYLAVDPIVRRFFPAPEAALLLALPPDDRRRLFFRSWCRKEAVLKALGRGLQGELPDLHTSSREFASVPLDVPAAPGWRFADVPIPHGFSAAVAAEGTGWSISTRHWPDVSGRAAASSLSTWRSGRDAGTS